MVAGSAFTFAYSIRLVHGVFFAEPGAVRPAHVTPHPHEGKAWLWGPAAVLAVGGLALGVFPGTAEQWLVAPMASSIARQRLNLDLALWHGIGWPLILSVTASTLGLAVLLGWRRVLAWPPLAIPGPDAAYNAGLALADRMAAACSARIQSGDLRRYVAVVIGALMAAALLPLLAGGVRFSLLETRPLFAHEGTALLLITVAALAIVFLRNRVAAVILLGAVGYLVGILFIILHAPDLALTQILIETVSLALFLLVLHRLPPYVPEEAGRRRVVRDVFLSGGAALAVALTLLATLGRSARESIAHYFLAESLPAAGGRNVVNVILIDFRGYDTLGEISVLAIGLLGVYALITLGRRA
jgi:multicomponent Na+:H+ antiporter subunit A